MLFFRKRKKASANTKKWPCQAIRFEPQFPGNKIALVACGCFWNPQGRFLKMDGIDRAIAGYTGGDLPYPCRSNLRDHSEALFIEYNPRIVTYRSILEMWHDNDFPWEPERFEQRSALFFLSLEQREQGIAFLNYLASQRPNSLLYVDLEPAKVFYQAEEDQQNYIAKQYIAARDQMVAWANNQSKSGLFSIVE